LVAFRAMSWPDVREIVAELKQRERSDTSRRDRLLRNQSQYRERGAL